MSERTKLAKKIHQTAKEKGWWDEERNHDEMFMLIITELAEAVEADREGRRADKKLFKQLLENYSQVDKPTLSDNFPYAFRKAIKDTIEDELADAYIRCLDYLYHRHREYIIFQELVFRPGSNFAQNIFSICRTVSDRLIREAAIMIEYLASDMDIDLQWHVKAKMAYNETRERKHGGKKY